MIIGIPKELKDKETRVGLIPKWVSLYASSLSLAKYASASARSAVPELWRMRLPLGSVALIHQWPESGRL